MVKRTGRKSLLEWLGWETFRGQGSSAEDDGLMDLTVGIPRALTYHFHPGLWETFFRSLGARVSVSAPTTEDTVKRASLISESEHCFSVKLFDAHVHALVEDVDAVFVPRILSTHPDHIACPKLGAVPDSVRAEFGDRVEVLTLDIDARRETLRSALCRLGVDLGADESTVGSAVEAACEALERAQEEARLHRAGGAERCLLLSHPYNIHNACFAGPIVEKLGLMDVEVEGVDFRRTPGGEGRIKWDTAAIMYDALQEMDPGQYDGVIQLTAFNCGCDSIVSEFYEQVVRDRRIPYMSIVVDEHTATTGTDTRLEAFIDSIRARKRKEE